MNIFKSGFFRDGTNALSMMRLVTFVVTFVVMAVWLALNFINALNSIKGHTPVTILDFQPQMVVVLVLVVAGKVGQAFTENINNK